MSTLSFFIEERPIFGAGVTGAVFRDTPLPPSRTRVSYCLGNYLLPDATWVTIINIQRVNISFNSLTNERLCVWTMKGVPLWHPQYSNVCHYSTHHFYYHLTDLVPWRRGHGRLVLAAQLLYSNSPSASVCHEQVGLPRLL